MEICVLNQILQLIRVGLQSFVGSKMLNTNHKICQNNGLVCDSFKIMLTIIMTLTLFISQDDVLDFAHQNLKVTLKFCLVLECSPSVFWHQKGQPPKY